MIVSFRQQPDNLFRGSGGSSMQTSRVTFRAPVVVVLALLWVVTASFACPEKCDCNSHGRVICARRELKDVPYNILPNTTVLDLGYNSIQNLSEADFSNLTSLVFLRLKNNSIGVLPAGIFSHHTRLLEVLDLAGNRIAHLPDGVFSNLTSLIQLLLNGNRIASLPAGIFSQLTRLERLELSDNHIADLPDGVFSNLLSLLELNLINNSISSLPSEIFSHLTRLEWLELSDNHIADLPGGVFSNLTSLRLLHLTNNRISSLPGGIFSQLTRLEWLNLLGNHIADLELPVFSNLASLERLILSDNSISSLQPGIFSHLTRLSLLELSGNNITDAPEGAFSNLTSLIWLFLSDNNISSLPVGIFSQLRNLGQLYLSENPLRCDCSLQNLMTSQRVRESLRDDPVCSSPPHMEGDALIGVVLLEMKICNRRGDCTTASADGSCACHVGWTGTYCGLTNIIVRVGSNENFTRNDQCGQTFAATPGQTREVYCNPTMSGRYVSVQRMGHALALCEVEVYVTGLCCDDAMGLLNGQITTTDGGYCSGNDIQFSCDPGYELVGNSSATCQEDGSWDGDLPTCQPHTEPTEEIRTSTEAIIAGNIAGIVAVMIVAAVVFMVFLRRRRRVKKDNITIQRRRMEEAIPLVPARPQFPRFETDPDRLTLGEKIGSGAFGLVYRATLTRNGKTQDVVVKTVKESASEDDKLGFLEEIRAVVDLGVHENLLGLVGCCTVVRDHLYLITEFMPYGDLKTFLRKCQELETSDEPRDDIYTFEVMQMYQVSRQIAKGMDHIAQSRYVHGDLAARNVLVGKRLHVKISDFGLAEDIYSRGYRRQDRLQRVPWKWMAPERLESGEAYTTQSNVWSFGIVLYEICTLGGNPYPGVEVRSDAAMLALAARPATVLRYAVSDTG
ncbi:PREDICTED: protein slit-like [Branchiostoma belcheri]|uniref:Protein slit-like n=1 Tax=Branchiostoma belcheri TaxID=7741 RepID=A0A6P5A0S9_BRABE|nr:PREDICTED: protein slit-like [Branchiostoma belcheri]